MQFNNMDGHIKSPKVQYLIVGLLCWQKGEREGYSAHQSQLSKWVREALCDQSTWIKLSILAPATPVPPWTSLLWARKQKNLSNPAAGFEAEIDTGCVQTVYSCHMTMKMKEVLLWSAVSLDMLPGNHGFLYVHPWPSYSSTSIAHPNEVGLGWCPTHLSNMPTALNLQSSCHPIIGHLLSSLPGPNARMHPDSSSPQTPSWDQSRMFKLQIWPSHRGRHPAGRMESP